MNYNWMVAYDYTMDWNFDTIIVIYLFSFTPNI